MKLSIHRPQADLVPPQSHYQHWPVRRRNPRTAKNMRCQKCSEPRRPRSMSASASPTLPDSSLRSTEVRVPQASTPIVFTGIPGCPAQDPGTGHRILPPELPRTDPRRLHAAAQSAPPCRPGQSGPGRRLHLPGCGAPAGQRERGWRGRTGRRRAHSPDAKGGCWRLLVVVAGWPRAHGRRALSQGASGAGGARGRRPRGAWRLRAGASGGTAAPRKEDNSLPLPQAAGSRGRPGTIWSSRPRGAWGGARVTPSPPGAMATAAPLGSCSGSPVGGL
ncbi:collagen alpha-1(III) chain-like [Rattus norvegicus]|uniref:collagen alpha-1(III) chain-like n=1 Tax=Rattus norvegicus TaxID=10116 RepID=UPI0019177F5C|nr:collagen alpha-1(III) chain-like [Rattus norvegicus]XP_038957254.1 collagen alpha-1(III) chain-like [Rattus norvegicus]